LDHAEGAIQITDITGMSKSMAALDKDGNYKNASGAIFAALGNLLDPATIARNTTESQGNHAHSANFAKKGRKEHELTPNP
jgi:hypothetical protein